MTKNFYQIFRVSFCLIFWAVLIPSVNAQQTFWLDEMDLTLTQCGWGTPQVNRPIYGDVFSIGGVKFERGIGTHASGEICVSNPAKAGIFHAEVGVSDQEKAVGPMEYLIYADDELVWKSG
ncbi:MAG: NPCBM/NEW2 domain-containing protein, partial [Thermoguttaceae bacterium]|nr:NPCBM/NEW2 domain-containing protein [Thermoguttaceae bacterium]